MGIPDNEYAQILLEFAPLAALAGALTITSGIYYARRSNYKQPFIRTVGTLLFTSIFAGALVVCTLCLAEWVLPPLSPKLELGVAVFIGIFGVNGIDRILRKKFNITLLHDDPLDKHTTKSKTRSKPSAPAKYDEDDI